MATKIRRALFIGLGGTGMTALLHTKKILYDNYGEIPPMLGFLGIDTDGGVYNKSLEARDGTLISLETAEQLPISVRNPTAIYRVGKGQEKYGWIAPGNENGLTVLSKGAGQLRSNGRFAITEKERDVRIQIQAKINQIANAKHIDNRDYEPLDSSVDVHVVFSLCGGTGAGTFINLAYILKDLLPDCKISGYAVMAEVFRAMLTGAAVSRVRSNSYGAIKDLDYLMSLTPASSGVKIEMFDGVKIENTRPFNALYLIDNKNSDNDTYTHVDQLSEMISLALVTSIGKLSDAAVSTADNVDKNIAAGDMDIVGKRAWVSSLGVSELIFDGKEIADIYAHKASAMVISMMTSGIGGDPSGAANNWINENKIRENLNKNDVIDYFIHPVLPKIPFDSLNTPDNPKPECDHYVNILSQEKKGTLDDLYEKLTKKIEVSLHELVNELVNRQGGVALCGSVLKAILGQMELCDGEMKVELGRFNDQKTLLESALSTSQQELENVRFAFFGRSKKVQAVCEDAVNLAVCKREIARREYARQFYTWMKNRVNDYIEMIKALNDNLQAVADKCTYEVEKIRRGIDNNSFFQTNLAADVVDSVVCNPEDIVFGDFVVKMKDVSGGILAFAGLSSDIVAAQVWKYTSQLPKTEHYSNQTIDDVLKGFSAEQLDSICKKAIKKAMPLLRTDLRGYHPMTSPDNSYYVGVSNKEESVLENNDFLKQRIPEADANVNIVPIGLKDRVIIYHQFGVVPAFAVSALDTFKPEYDAKESSCPGTSHWDYVLYQRFKEEHFDFMPMDELEEDEIVGAWLQALLYEIVTKNKNNEFFINSRELGGLAIDNFMVKIGGKRIDAYNYFVENLSVIKAELEDKVSKIVEKDRTLPGKLKAKIKAEVSQGVYHHPGHISLNYIPVEELKAVYMEEYNQLNKEIEYILGL